MSRGMLLATAASTTAVLLLPVRGASTGTGQRLVRMAVAGVIPLSLLLVWERFSESDAALRLAQRLEDASSGADGGIRFEIWQSALSQMTNVQWVFGAGPASFRDLAWRSGYDYYSHSVYVDVLVSTGLLGALSLGILLLVSAVAIGRRREALGAGLLILLVFGFATHGSAGSPHFWLIVGLLRGRLGVPHAISSRARIAQGTAVHA